MNFNNMDDDEFRKKFIKLINFYKLGMDEFFNKKIKKKDDTNNEDGLGPDFLNNLFTPSGFPNPFIPNNLNDWDRKDWESKDGLRSFTTFTRKNIESPFNNEIKPQSHVGDIDTMTLLENKLNKAIINEDYEDAAKIRDLMLSIKNK